MFEGKRIFDGIESEAAGVQLPLVDVSECAAEVLAANPNYITQLEKMEKVAHGQGKDSGDA